MTVLDKYHAADTSYKEAPSDDHEPEASYDAGAWNYQIVDDSGDIIALFSDKAQRDHVLKLLLANPFPEIVTG